jgi:Uma2 family endonuclease
MTGRTDPTPATSKLTYQDYLELPDDNRRYEILDGELAVTASPTTRHQRVSLNLAFLLHAEVDRRGLGVIFYAPVDVILDESTVVVPDLVFVSTAKASIITRRAIEGPPDLVMEILSESTERRDRGAKMKLLARFGVDWYWLVDPEARTLEIFRRRDDVFSIAASHHGDDVVECTVPDGVRIELARVWAD